MRVLLTLALLIILASCDDAEKVQPVNIAGVSDHPAQISYNTTMTFSSEGIVKAVLHARRVRTYEDQRFTYLDSGVRVNFFDREGRHTTTLTSQSASVNLANNNMTAYTNVHIVSDSGTVVDTDSLQWLNKEQQLHSDAHVRIAEKNGRVTTGIGFQSDQSLAHYQILRPTIETPGDVWTDQTHQTLKPEPTEIPGTRAFTPQPQLQLQLADSARRGDSSAHK
jgi:LPS export ABC transporter protein LptC